MSVTKKLDELEQIGKEATARPWHSFDGAMGVMCGAAVGRSTSLDAADTRFIIASRNHWQALIDVAKAAQDVRECDAIMKTCGKGTAKWASFMQDKIQAEKRLDAALKKLEEIE